MASPTLTIEPEITTSLNEIENEFADFVPEYQDWGFGPSLMNKPKFEPSDADQHRYQETYDAAYEKALTEMAPEYALNAATYAASSAQTADEIAFTNRFNNWIKQYNAEPHPVSGPESTPFPAVTLDEMATELTSENDDALEDYIDYYVNQYLTENPEMVFPDGIPRYAFNESLVHTASSEWPQLMNTMNRAYDRWNTYLDALEADYQSSPEIRYQFYGRLFDRIYLEEQEDHWGINSTADLRIVANGIPSTAYYRGVDYANILGMQYTNERFKPIQDLINNEELAKNTKYLKLAAETNPADNVESAVITARVAEKEVAEYIDFRQAAMTAIDIGSTTEWAPGVATMFEPIRRACIDAGLPDPGNRDGVDPFWAGKAANRTQVGFDGVVFFNTDDVEYIAEAIGPHLHNHQDAVAEAITHPEFGFSAQYLRASAPLRDAWLAAGTPNLHNPNSPMAANDTVTGIKRTIPATKRHLAPTTRSSGMSLSLK